VWEGYRVYYKGEEEDKVNELLEEEGSVFKLGTITTEQKGKNNNTCQYKRSLP